MIVVTTDDPSSFGYDFDVFVVDCKAHTPEQVRLLRAEAPDALFLAFVDGLDRDIVMQLVNSGVQGAFDSTIDSDHEELASRIRGYVSRLTDAPATAGVLGVMRSMADLVRQWNRRLDRLEGN